MFDRGGDFDLGLVWDKTGRERFVASVAGSRNSRVCLRDWGTSNRRIQQPGTPVSSLCRCSILYYGHVAFVQTDVQARRRSRTIPGLLIYEFDTVRLKPGKIVSEFSSKSWRQCQSKRKEIDVPYARIQQVLNIRVVVFIICVYPRLLLLVGSPLFLILSKLNLSNDFI